MPKSWKSIGLRKVTISNTEYYEVYSGNNVGDIFSNWRDTQQYKEKLFTQLTKI